MTKHPVTFPVAEGLGIFVGIIAWDLLTDGRVDIAKALLIAVPFSPCKNRIAHMHANGRGIYQRFLRLCLN